MLEPLSALALIIALGVGAEWLANSFGIPSIALLLVAGVIVGPATGLIEPDMLLGDLLFPIVSLAVAVVLFEGGMNLRFSDFRAVRTSVLLLTTVGVAITWAGSTVAGWWLFGFHLEVAMLLGAILVVTGPTVVMPLLRNMDVDERLETVATWEGIVNDPIGAVLTVSVYELAISHQTGPGVADAASTLMTTLTVGTIFAGLGGLVLIGALARNWAPRYLEVPVTLGVLMAAFGGAEAVSPEAGLVAATALGVVVANQDRIDSERIFRFKKSLGVVLIAVLFIVLAARFEMASFYQISTQSALYLALLICVIRPLAVAAAGIPAGLNWREIIGLSALGARGIVAAALASLFAIKLVEHGYPEARQLDAEVFFVITGSVVFSSLVAQPLIRALSLDGRS